jgi:curli biogenesis system outer membrane secretion channel CsgG
MAASLILADAGAQTDRLRGYEPPQVEAGRSTQMLANLPPKAHSDRVAVSIYEFRSSVTEIPARATTDMFKTALVRSGQFRVVERARVAEGVLREKQLNAAGLSDGNAGGQALRTPKYLFEGTISEATQSQTQQSGVVTIAGMEVGGASNRDVISIDVRVVEVASGDVIDVVTVRKPIASESSGVSGLGNIISTVLSQRGRPTTYVPDVQVQQQRRESLDQALREAIDQAVATLAAQVAR